MTPDLSKIQIMLELDKENTVFVKESQNAHEKAAKRKEPQMKETGNFSINGQEP